MFTRRHVSAMLFPVFHFKCHVIVEKRSAENVLEETAFLCLHKGLENISRDETLITVSYTHLTLPTTSP